MLKVAKIIFDKISLRTDVWSDFGFLLKIARSNYTLSELTSVDDIDIAILFYPELEDDLRSCLSEVSKDISFIYIGETLIMVKVGSPNRNDLAIDISIYYERIPNVYETYMVFRDGWGQYSLKNLMSRILLCPYYLMNHKRSYKWPSKITSNKYFSAIFRVALIQVSASTVIPVQKKNVSGSVIACPWKIDLYLTGRYGDWTTKNNKWVFNRDQKDLVVISLKSASKLVGVNCV